jgi:hypothetical protein
VASIKVLLELDKAAAAEEPKPTSFDQLDELAKRRKPVAQERKSERGRE